MRDQRDGRALAAAGREPPEARALRLHAVEEGRAGADAQPLLDLQQQQRKEGGGRASGSKGVVRSEEYSEQRL